MPIRGEYESFFLSFIFKFSLKLEETPPEGGTTNEDASGNYVQIVHLVYFFVFIRISG